MKPLGPPSQPPPSAIVALTTGERIRLRREAKGLTRPVVAGLVGRSSDWLKKIESGTRRLNSLPMLVRIADVLGVDDLSELTGDSASVPVSAFGTEVHHVVPGIREAMRQAGFSLASETLDTYSHLWPDEEEQTRTAIDLVMSTRPTPTTPTATGTATDGEPQAA